MAKSEIVKLGEMIAKHAERVERGTNDSRDVGFFAIKLAADSDLTALRLKNAIVRAEEGMYQSMPVEDLLNDQGVSYTALGAWLGDQGLGLALIGLGAELGLWDVVLPSDVGVLDGPLFQQMIGMGFVNLLVGPESILRK
ncbi:hypothetical protein SEA_MAGRITTE_238 [Microbacterium phage Magritte]|nr:hypothetical protein SEA_MAGRITTE_238 [Microbacterium phage Magritte]